MSIARSASASPTVVRISRLAVLGVEASPLLGPEGNREFLIAAQKAADARNRCRYIGGMNDIAPPNAASPT